MRMRMFALAATGLLAISGLTACTDDDPDDNTSSGSTGETSSGSGESRVGVILPDTTTAQRWRTDDPKFLKAAFERAGVKADIQNAGGDPAAFLRIADE